MKHLAISLAAVVFAGAALAFEPGEKGVVRKLVDDAQAAFREAALLDVKAITLLPVRGDQDGYAERLIVGALVKAGRMAVVSNDDKNDERFQRILKEIRWDAEQTRLASVDPATIDELGRLKSSQILMEARLDMATKTSRHGKPPKIVAELNILAYEIATKRYVWSENFVFEEKPEPPSALPGAEKGVAVVAVPLAVKVDISPTGESAAGIAARLDSAVRGELVSMGYKVEAEGAPDIEIAAGVASSTFDESGSYVVFEGTLRAKATLNGPEARLLGDTTIDERGLRGLGKFQADRNLADALATPFAEWLKRTVSHDVVGCEAVVLEVKFSKPLEAVEDVVRIEQFRAAAASLDGARSVTLVSQDNAAGTATYRAVYDKAKFPVGFLNALFTTHPELSEVLAR